MNALSNNNAAVPAVTFVPRAIARELYIELVPGAGNDGAGSWRDRLASGMKPSMYYSVACEIPAGDQIVRAEFNIQATDENGMLLPIDGLTNGEFTFCPVKDQVGFAATEPGGEVTKSRKGDKDVVHVKLRPDGTPAVIGELPAGWAGWNVIKSVAHRVPGMTFLLENVSLSYSGSCSKAGHPFVKARVGSYSIVDAPAGLKASGTPIAAPKFAAAARRSAPAVAAPLPNTTVSSEVLP
jgi:hypothetical protein